MSVVSIENLSKHYRNSVVFSRLSLQINAQERILLLGKNGSGKSTLLKILSGLASKTDGIFHVQSSQIGYTHHQPMLYGALTVKENIRLFQKLTGNLQETDAYLESWNLIAIKDKQVQSLSQGQKALTSLARAFVKDPEFILLDEPTSFLDRSNVSLLLERIKSKTVLLATHDVERLKPVATRVIVLNEGVIGSDSQTSSINDSIEYYHRCNH